MHSKIALTRNYLEIIMTMRNCTDKFAILLKFLPNTFSTVVDKNRAFSYFRSSEMVRLEIKASLLVIEIKQALLLKKR